MLNKEQFFKESLDANLYYLRVLRDYCININLSFNIKNEYTSRALDLAKECQELGRELITLTGGKVPSDGVDYQIFYTNYTLDIERLTEQLFNIDLATDITENQLKLTKTDNFVVDDNLENNMNNINDKALTIAREFLTLANNILENLTTNKLFSYSYPAIYNYMIISAELYIGELNRIKQRILKDPIIAIDTEYGNNITAYEITAFLRGLINPNAQTYIEPLNDILNNKYQSLLSDYNNLPLSPENQQEFNERSQAIIREIRLLISDMLKDLLNSSLYFITDALAIDTFYRNINYILLSLNNSSSI